VNPAVHGGVRVVAEIDRGQLAALLSRFGLTLHAVPDGSAIPYSYWGDPESGLAGTCLYARSDTPVHSVLHEAAHFICMDAVRRRALERDAGGDHAEEDAVCYLQILLADELCSMGRARMLADMDAWGYTFRLGSAAAWLARDAVDAAGWLVRAGVIDAQARLTWRRREQYPAQSATTLSAQPARAPDGSDRNDRLQRSVPA